MSVVDEELFVARLPFTPGPTEAIDHLINQGVDAIEISWRLLIPIWIIRERFARRAGQFDARARDLQVRIK